MALKLVFTAIAFVGLFCPAARGAFDPPLAAGSGLATFGTVRWASTLQGWDPSQPVAVCSPNTRALGVSVVDIYDDTPESADRDIRQMSAGVARSWERLSVSLSVSTLNALGVYREHTAQFSGGLAPIPAVRLSAEIEYGACGMSTQPLELRTVLFAGGGAWLERRYAALSVQMRGLALTPESVPGLHPPRTLSLGLHTDPHRRGSQGIVFDIRESGGVLSLRWRGGISIQALSALAVCAGFRTNPAAFALGLSLRLNRTGTHAALVHDPVLGLSKGYGAVWIDPMQ